MEENINTPEQKGNGIGPVIIISAVLIGLLVVLKLVMD